MDKQSVTKFFKGIGANVSKHSAEILTAMGVVGMASYVAAGIQDVVSGALIDSSKTIVDGVTIYDFSNAAIFWIGASIISFMLPILNWRRKVQN